MVAKTGTFAGADRRPLRSMTAPMTTMRAIQRRERLPNRLVVRGETFEVDVAGLRYTATSGPFPDGRIWRNLPEQSQELGSRDERAGQRDRLQHRAPMRGRHRSDCKDLYRKNELGTREGRATVLDRVENLTLVFGPFLQSFSNGLYEQPLSCFLGVLEARMNADQAGYRSNTRRDRKRRDQAIKIGVLNVDLPRDTTGLARAQFGAKSSWWRRRRDHQQMKILRLKARTARSADWGSMMTRAIEADALCAEDSRCSWLLPPGYVKASGVRFMIDVGLAAWLLGGNVAGKNQIVCPGPGHSRRDRSLSVRFDPRAAKGFIVHSFAGDDPIAARDYVRERLGLPAWQPGDERDRDVPASRLKEFDRMTIDRKAECQFRSEDDLLRIKRANALWDEAKEPRGTMVQDYLRSRALDLPEDVAEAVLRSHPRCPWRSEETGKTELVPAMLVSFRSLDDDIITGVHRIRLDQPQQWPKVERRMLGVVRRTAVKLDPVSDKLVIGEGVETAMAARQLGHKPAWALGSVGAISFFPVVDSVKHLVILGETGPASEVAIRLCGQRWKRALRRVQVIMPDVGSDINDELIARAI